MWGELWDLIVMLGCFVAAAYLILAAGSYLAVSWGEWREWRAARRDRAWARRNRL